MNRSRRKASPLAWLRDTFTPRGRQQRRRGASRYPVLTLEYLEDRIVPTQYKDLGGLRFSADSFAQEGTVWTAEGIDVLLGYAPTHGEAFHGLVDVRLHNSASSVGGQLKFDTSVAPPKFSVQKVVMESIAQGAAPLPIWQTPDQTTWVDFDINQLTSASGLVLTNAKPFPVAHVDFTLNKLAFANPGGGDTANSELKMQGTAGFPKLQNWDLSQLQVRVDGTNYVIASFSGLTLTGATAAFSNPGMDLAGIQGLGTSLAITYAKANGHDTFTVDGGLLLSTAPQDTGQQRALNQVGANASLTFADGDVTALGFDITANFNVFGLKVATDPGRPLHFDYNFTDQQFEVYGGLKATFPDQQQSNVDVKLGDLRRPGLVIRGGELTQLNATIDTAFSLLGAKITTRGAGLNFVYDRDQEQFEMWGALSLQVPTKGGSTTTLTAQMGDAGDPGLIIQHGALQQINMSLSGQFDLFGLTIVVSGAGMQYQKDSQGNDVFEIFGTVSVQELWQASVQLGTASQPGITIDDGHFRLDSLTIGLTNVNLGAFTVQDLTVAYTSAGPAADYTLTVTLDLVFPQGWSAGGTVTFADGQIDGIQVDYSAGSSNGIPVGDTGLYLTYIDASVQNIQNPDNLVVSGAVAFTYGQTISILGHDVAIFVAEGSFTVDKHELVVTGQDWVGAYQTGTGPDLAPTYDGVLGSGSATLTLDWGSHLYELQVSQTMYGGIFQLSGVLAFDGGGDIVLAAKASVQVPGEIPVIGGFELGNLDFLFEYHKGHLDQSFVAAWTEISIPLIVTTIHIKVGFEFDLNKHLSVIGGGTIDAFDGCFNDPTQCLSSNNDYTYFSSYQAPAGATGATLTASWPQAVGTQSLSVTEPDGTTITQDQFPFIDQAKGIAISLARSQDDNGNSLTSPTSLTVHVVSLKPDVPLPAGDYKLTLTSTQQFDDTAVNFTSLFSFPDPTINVGVLPAPQGPSNVIAVPLSGTVDEEFKDQTHVTLYVDNANDPGHSHGVPVTGATNLPITTDGQGHWSLTADWDLTGLVPVTNYYVYAVINDGTNPAVTSGNSAGVLPLPPIDGQVTDVAHSGQALPGMLVYLDLNHDGRYDPPVYDQNGNLVTPGEPTSITNADGFYEFWSVTPNQPYDIGLVVPQGYLLDTGNPENTNPRKNVVYNGVTPVSQNFGLDKLAAISGTAFNDLHQDGRQDPGDPGLANWIVVLTAPGLAPVTASTDQNGNYSFLGLTPSTTYTVSLTPQSGYYQTSPAPVPAGTYTVALGSDPYQQVTGEDFGIQPVATISGNVSGNTPGNSGTTPLQGWTVQARLGLPINAGGGPAGTFLADRDVSGSSFEGSTTAAIDVSQVTDPAPQAVYQTYRWGPDFSYAVTGLQPGGVYPVRLHFAELFWTKRGQRVFNVAINDQPELTNFDVLATAGGPDVAVARSFTATADATGTITIRFTKVTDNAEVNGIEVGVVPGVGGTATTDANGNYSISGLPAGPYAVSETLPAGWKQTLPLDDAHLQLTPLGGDFRSLGVNPNSIVIADLAGDGGRQYAILDPRTETVSIFLHGMPPGPSAVIYLNAGSGQAQKIVAGDFLGNGRQDVAVLNSGGWVDLIVNRGGGNFQYDPKEWVLPPSGGGAIYDMIAGNFGGPGDEIAVAFDNAAQGYDQISTLFVNSSGQAGMIASAMAYAPLIEVPIANLALFHDLANPSPGHGSDLVVGIQNSTDPVSPFVLDNVGNGLFNYGYWFEGTTHLPQGPVVVGDINGDGTLDVGVFALNGQYFSQGRFYYALQNSHGAFSDPVETQIGDPGATITSASLVDLTGDGRPDLVWLENTYSNPLHVVLNTGQAGAYFTPSHQTSWPLGENGAYGAVMALGDVDGIGLPSIVVADPTNSDVSIVHNHSFVGPGRIVIVAVAGNTSAGNDFVNAQLGQINGRVFEDVTGDGHSLLSKPGHAGATVYVDLNHDGRLDPNDPRVVTGPDGVYAFDGLAPGTYDVRVVPEAGRRPTTADGLVQVVTVRAGQPPVTGIDFGSTVGIDAVWDVRSPTPDGDWTLRRNGARLELVDSQRGVIDTATLADLNSLTINAGAGRVTIDVKDGGFFRLPGGVTVNSPPNSRDTLRFLLGGGTDDVTVTGTHATIDTGLMVSWAKIGSLVIDAGNGDNRLSVSGQPVPGGTIDLIGGTGNDTYALSTQNSAVPITDAGGMNTLDFSAARAGVNVNLGLDHGQTQHIGGGNNTLALRGTIEELIGTPYNDVLIGNGANDVIRGLAGNDVLIAGSGNSVLVGGPGNDVLIAGPGRDLLIGGPGNDVLVGYGMYTGGRPSAGSVLVGGSTAYDANDQALRAILAEWSSNRSYAQRVANLRNGSGGGRRLNGSYFLDAQTVHAGGADVLFGDSRVDWFLASPADWVIDSYHRGRRLQGRQG